MQESQKLIDCKIPITKAEVVDCTWKSGKAMTGIQMKTYLNHLRQLDTEVRVGKKAKDYRENLLSYFQRHQQFTYDFTPCKCTNCSSK